MEREGTSKPGTIPPGGLGWNTGSGSLFLLQVFLSLSLYQKKSKNAIENKAEEEEDVRKQYDMTEKLS